MSELLKEQEQFVNWLKSKRMYNPMESAYTMQKMHTVWKTLREEHVHDEKEEGE